MALNYNAPNETASSIDKGLSSSQMNTFFWLKKALIEARKEQFFMPLASTIDMPKHFGKKIKVYEYIPLLDDRNKNDQGIDAKGATEGASGNLYGSSKDIGTIVAKLPTLTENGGRVNRVGFSRKMLEGSLHKFGFFYEFSQEALDFDSDDGLKDHLARELMNGATQLTEAVLQKDLLTAATTVVYPGTATKDSDVTAEGADGENSKLTYKALMRLDQILTDHRTPKHTKVITGSRMVDTKTLPACRIAYIGSELVPELKTMKDFFGERAFIEVQHYANAGTTLNGEIGAVGPFRFIQVPEMLHWAGAGKAVTSNPGYRATDKSGQKYDIFPVLVVGDESFATIGFQTDGKSVKFNVLTKMPGKETAGREDPYGELGFSSIKWYYGFLAKRPERIGLIKTVAPV